MPKRQTASPGLPLGGVCDFHAYWHDSRQVFGLAGCLLAPASQFKFCPWLDPNFTSALVGVSFLLTAAGQFRICAGFPFQVRLAIHHRKQN
jgi:hypothetical protein